MRTLNNGDTFMHHGRQFQVHFKPDCDAGPPWKESDGHGVVSEWTTRGKRPGERVLAAGRIGQCYYDVEASMHLAIANGWGVRNPPPDATRGQIAALAVEQDFEHLRRWCADAWYYVGVIVTDLASGDSDSLWCVADDGDYAAEVAFDLAANLHPLADAHEAAALEMGTD